MFSRVLELLSEIEECFRVCPEFLALFLGVGKVAAILGHMEGEVVGDPGRVAHVVYQLAGFGVHGGNALDAGCAVANHGHALVVPVIRVVPVWLD